MREVCIGGGQGGSTGGRSPLPKIHGILLQNTANKPAVRILLECILVLYYFLARILLSACLLLCILSTYVVCDKIYWLPDSLRHVHTVRQQLLLRLIRLKILIALCVHIVRQ